jgi:A/G-specific adenine glycosylase
LRLTVYALEVPAEATAPPEMRWVPLETLDSEAFPSLMRKVIAHAMPPAPPRAVANPQFTFAGGNS